MLPLELIMGVIVLIPQLAMNLSVLPWIQPLLMSFGMLFLDLIMGITMFIVDAVVFLFVAPVLGISVTAITVGIAIPVARIAVAGIAIAITRSN